MKTENNGKLQKLDKIMMKCEKQKQTYADYQKNLTLSKDYLRKVLLCTYFPEYLPSIGTDMHSDEYIDAQINHIEFFAGRLHNAIKQLRRSNSDPELNVKYDKLFSCLTEMLENHNT